MIRTQNPRILFRSAVIAGILHSLAPFSFAETTQATAPAAEPSKLIAGAEVRPSYYVGDEAYRTEDSVELGYRLSANANIRYVQTFTTNISDPALSPEASGVDFKFDRGFVRTQLNNILKSADGSLSLSYENRVYLPTAGYDRDANVALILRNYVKLQKKFSSTFSLSLMDLPILQINSRPGFETAKGSVANAVFQNRVYLIPTVSLTDKLSFFMPIMFHQTRYANYREGASRNASWDYFVWAYPEISYQLTRNISVGAAFYTGNLVKSDLSQLTLSQGFETGVAQAVVGVTL